MHSTRSPALIWSLTLANVIGMAAGPTLPYCGNVSGTRSGSMPRPLGDQAGVDLADLVDDVPVHADFPVEVVAGVLPGCFGEVEPGDQQAVRVGLHAIEVADAQLVVLRSRTGHAADEAVGVGVLVHPADDRRCGTRTERQRRELGEHVGGFGRRPLETGDRGLLREAAAFTVDDQGVVDLAGVDRRGGDLHAVDEPETGVADVEVETARRRGRGGGGRHRRPTARGGACTPTSR